jgi:hypothetical protein
VAVRDATGAETAQRFTLRVRPPVVEEAILVVPVPAEPNRYAFTLSEAGEPRRELTVRGGFVVLEPLGGLAQPMRVDTVGREPGSMRPVTGAAAATAGWSPCAAVGSSVSCRCSTVLRCASTSASTPRAWTWCSTTPAVAARGRRTS